jgi:hypothetical protein
VGNNDSRLDTLPDLLTVEPLAVLDEGAFASYGPSGVPRRTTDARVIR